MPRAQELPRGLAVKLSVIALDYDGTIARGDVLDASVRDAIAAARTQGIVVLLVTGRILDELRRVAGDLHFVDGVIAENGAVIHFPDSGRTSALAPLVPEGFVAELRRRGIPFAAGQCLVDADANEAPRLLEVIRSLELPLVLIFNRGRVMTAPQGVSKATGLHVVLETLRLSARNTVAIGDAENDHELLRLAEVGVAVEWGSKALQAAADVVLNGQRAGSRRRLRANARGDRKSPDSAARPTSLLLGHLEDGREFSLAVRGRNVLVTGDAKSGKVLGRRPAVRAIDPARLLRLCHRSRRRLQLARRPARRDRPRTRRRSANAPRAAARASLPGPQRGHRPVSPAARRKASVRPSGLAGAERAQAANRTSASHSARRSALLPARRRRTATPRLRAQWLHGRHVLRVAAAAGAARGTEVMIVTCESNPAEMEALRARCAGCAEIDASRWARARPPEGGPGGRAADHRRGRRRVATVHDCPAPHASRPTSREVRGRARELPPGVRLHRKRSARPQDSDASAVRVRVGAHAATLLAGYVVRSDFSRWIADVFGDRALADELRALEARYRAGAREETVSEMANAVRGRYDLAGDELGTIGP